MARRPPSEIVQCLRATLRHLDENLAIGAEPAHLTDIKRTILLRIAAIEANRPTETTKGAESLAQPSAAISEASGGEAR